MDSELGGFKADRAVSDRCRGGHTADSLVLPYLLMKNIRCSGRLLILKEILLLISMRLHSWHANLSIKLYSAQKGKHAGQFGMCMTFRFLTFFKMFESFFIKCKMPYKCHPNLRSSLHWYLSNKFCNKFAYTDQFTDCFAEACVEFFDTIADP